MAAMGAVLVLGVAGCSGDASTPSGTQTPASAQSTSPQVPTGSPTVPVTTRPTQRVTKAPPAATPSQLVAVSTAPDVRIGAKTQIKERVAVRVLKVTELDLKAEQPGDIKGAAVAVRLRVENDSAAPFDLGGMVVTASYHHGTPGDQSAAGPSDLMTGLLAPGRTDTGTYVFRVPHRYASSLRLEVSSNESPTIVEFVR